MAPGESGFTLIELLVVMLILGTLSAIALSSFFAQGEKAYDAKAKDSAHAIQVAIESCGTENDSYQPCKKAALLKAEPELNSSPNFTAASAEAGAGYKIVVTADSTADKFEIKRSNAGVLTFSCSAKASGGCPADKRWGDGD